MRCGSRWGDDLAEGILSKWMTRQATAEEIVKSDPVAMKLKESLVSLGKDESFRLGNQDYTVRRARGKGASGFIVAKNEK